MYHCSTVIQGQTEDWVSVNKMVYVRMYGWLGMVKMIMIRRTECLAMASQSIARSNPQRNQEGYSVLLSFYYSYFESVLTPEFLSAALCAFY